MTDAEMIDSPEAGKQLARLRAIMHRLRAPGGCPWDAEQTHASLVPNLIEEAYETVDTIQRGDHEHLKEELGDLLLQVVFHSELAEEAGHFNLDDVARGISDKLVRRHPHVFARSDAATSEAVLQQWDADQTRRKRRRGATLPAWHRQGPAGPAARRQTPEKSRQGRLRLAGSRRACSPNSARNSRNCEAAIAAGIPPPSTRNSATCCSRWSTSRASARLDPEVLMAAANAKFERRFAAMERDLKQQGLDLAAPPSTRWKPPGNPPNTGPNPPDLLAARVCC